MSCGVGELSQSERLSGWVTFLRAKASFFVMMHRLVDPGFVQSTADLLCTDIDLAMTMTDIAASAERGSEKWERNLQNARKADHDVSRTLRRLAEFDPKKAEEIAPKLERLRGAIAELERCA